MKVLLINPPWYRLQNTEYFGYPIGLCYLAAACEKNGVDAVVYNADFEKRRKLLIKVSDMTDAYSQYLQLLRDLEHPFWKEVKRVISQSSPDMVGVAVTTGGYGSALNVARLVKDYDPDVPVVFGGPHPTILPEKTVKNREVDYVVRGEGEITFLELVRNYDSGKMDGCLGITFEREGKVIHNSDRPLIRDLDSLPFPARHLLLNRNEYASSDFGSLFTSRGCPFSCIFCASHKIWGRRVRYRSANNVIDEVKSVYEAFDTRNFRFEDDNFTLNRKRLEEICNLLIKEKLDISWYCETRVDLINEEIVKKMKKAGCTSVSIGVESGDPQTLRKIKKAITLEQVYKATHILKENNIFLAAFFMVGFPWERKEEILRTVSLMKDIDPDLAVYSIATPYPGTELFDMSEAEGLIPADLNWSNFFHQSPSMFLTKNLTKNEIREIIEETERIFDKHNLKKGRERLVKHPLSTAKSILKKGYYKHPWVLIRQLLDRIYI